MALTRHKIRGYGWIPDIPDHRDHLYAAPAVSLAKLPKQVDLRPQCPKVVYDQGQLGSCTGNAIAGAFQFERHKQKLKPDFIPSRLFIYYNERVIEGTVASDDGASIRDGIKSVATLGDCPEKLWPYDIGKFASKPSKAAFAEALRYKAVQYQRVSRVLNQMKGCMASGYPFVFGFSVYESFESQKVAKTGVVPMPASSETLLGGHAVLAVGYDDATQRFIVRNSWGPKWGMRGYFTMPYGYLLDAGLSDDFWTIRVIAH
jgi:C1A family cysteine protease